MTRLQRVALIENIPLNIWNERETCQEMFLSPLPRCHAGDVMMCRWGLLLRIER